MMSRCKSLWIVLCVAGITLVSPAARAGHLTIHVGPPALGNGGPNPLSIPPLNPTEYEVIYLSDNDFESNIAITPGLLFGPRTELPYGMYVGMGGGLVIDANGTGPGVYSSLGINCFEKFQFNAEIKQAVGISFSGGVLNPYAIRIGVTFEL